VRTRDGTFTKFDPSNGTFGEQQIGTTMAINPAGAVTGYYQTGDYTWHDFLRAPNGTFTKFDFPIPGAGSQGTYPFCHQPGGRDRGMVLLRKLQCSWLPADPRPPR
jgi:hypothetical protein